MNMRTRSGRPAAGPRIGRTALLLPLVALLAGCAGSTTPLPDLTAALPKVLSPQEKEQAVNSLEQRKAAADEAARQIERDRTKQ